MVTRAAAVPLLLQLTPTVAAVAARVVQLPVTRGYAAGAVMLFTKPVLQLRRHAVALDTAYASFTQQGLVTRVEKTL